MTLFYSILYGIIQGITEFLPISSSAHLAIMHHITGLDPNANLAFDILLHVGTLVAVLSVYFKEILALIPAFFTLIAKFCRGLFKRDTEYLKFSNYTVNERLALLLIIATAPLALAVFDFVDGINTFARGSLIFIGAALFVNGFILFVSDRVARAKYDLETVRPRHALVVGLAQFIAIIPGLSRSGTTITGGLFAGMDRATAVKFSFLMSIPAIIGASIMELPAFFRNIPGTQELAIYMAGAVAAAIVGFFAIKLLQYIAKKANFTMFAYYCWAVGLGVVVWGVVG
ncbi:MAG: undecaprenyl-diphosphate phosphatase [Oscillospiraceae bacterium]|nr:undecaprenyl-diphosphate phosphatase [Oscillospiraceae bacterium]